MQVPESLIRRSASRRPWTDGMSRPFVGSSSSTWAGESTIARPSATFIRSPCEKPATRRSATRVIELGQDVLHAPFEKAGQDALEPAEVRDVLAGGQTIVEPLVIEKGAEPPAALQGRRLIRANPDRTLIGPKEAANQCEGGRLAGAVLAEDARNPAVCRTKRDVAHGADRPEGFSQVSNFNHGNQLSSIR